jgi:hypothetical protein
MKTAELKVWFGPKSESLYRLYQSVNSDRFTPWIQYVLLKKQVCNLLFLIILLKLPTMYNTYFYKYSTLIKGKVLYTGIPKEGKDV